MTRPVPAKPKLSSQGTVIWATGIPHYKIVGSFPLGDVDSCSRCERSCRLGEFAFRDNEGKLVGVSCCATEDDISVPKDAFGELADDFEGRDFVALSQVMPRGRSAADKCPRCFQIPANNGACCE